jgi:hypothetical protein
MSKNYDDDLQEQPAKNSSIWTRADALKVNENDPTGWGLWLCQQRDFWTLCSAERFSIGVGESAIPALPDLLALRHAELLATPR